MYELGKVKVCNCVLIVACALQLGAVQASVQLERAKVCLQDSTSGKDRKILVRWIFSAFASNPDLQEFLPTKQRKVTINREAVELFQRLLLKDCLSEFRALGNNSGFEEAFNHLGQIAAAEMMQDKSFKRAIEEFGKSFDLEKFERAYR